MDGSSDECRRWRGESWRPSIRGTATSAMQPRWQALHIDGPRRRGITGWRFQDIGGTPPCCTTKTVPKDVGLHTNPEDRGETRRTTRKLSRPLENARLSVALVIPDGVHIWCVAIESDTKWRTLLTCKSQRSRGPQNDTAHDKHGWRVNDNNTILTHTTIDVDTCIDRNRTPARARQRRMKEFYTWSIVDSRMYNDRARTGYVTCKRTIWKNAEPTNVI